MRFVADEIDSIGKQRLDGDQSSSEQQNGLLQLLYEMDSYARDDKVGCRIRVLKFNEGWHFWEGLSCNEGKT